MGEWGVCVAAHQAPGGPESRRPGTELTSCHWVCHSAGRARGRQWGQQCLGVYTPHIIRVTLGRKPGRYFIPRNRGPERQWVRSGRSLCSAGSSKTSESIPPAGGHPARDPRDPRGRARLYTGPAGPGLHRNTFPPPPPPCGPVLSAPDGPALQHPLLRSRSATVTMVGRSLLRCSRLPLRGCRDTQGTRRELWAALWKLPKGVGAPR